MRRCASFIPLLLLPVLFACGGRHGAYPVAQQASQAAASPGAYTLSTRGDKRFSGEAQPGEYLQENACDLLDDRPHWIAALREVNDRWQLQPWYILAFLHQESRFHPTAMSTSRAYGYAQIKDESWDWYLSKTGNTVGSRERFDDAVDFIGFYANANVRRNGVDLNDVKNQYLAYHEGMGGYQRGSHLDKPWLLTVSDKVVDRAAMYQAQLLECPIL